MSEWLRVRGLIAIWLSCACSEGPGPEGVMPSSSFGGSSATINCDDAIQGDLERQCRLLRPSAEECSAPSEDGWAGCSASGCRVCREALVDYPYYFDWHPCCAAANCDDAPSKLCDQRCPEPSAHDAVQPCFVVGTRARP